MWSRIYVGIDKNTLTSPGFNETWLFVDRFSKNAQLPSFMKIRSVEVEFFHPDGEVWSDEANSRLKTVTLDWMNDWLAYVYCDYVITQLFVSLHICGTSILN
jgi:hypothetical protein